MPQFDFISLSTLIVTTAVMYYVVFYIVLRLLDSPIKYGIGFRAHLIALLKNVTFALTGIRIYEKKVVDSSNPKDFCYYEYTKFKFKKPKKD
jgi:hypothetical protein